MKRLAIDWGELSLAFDNSFWEASCYLDTETGQVLWPEVVARAAVPEDVMERVIRPLQTNT